MAKDFLGQAIKYPIVISPTFGRPELIREKELIIQAITQLFDTPIGSNFVNPDWGSYVRFALFEQNDIVLQELLITFMGDAIDQWEPRARFVGVDFEKTDDDAVINCIVKFFINATNELETFVYPFYRELEY